ncbi:proteasome subunit beta [Candidatus Woesearchaeota archaeon]|nr:proteasome subunit beta [Candidatus Woesearchaeota archaeon]
MRKEQIDKDVMKTGTTTVGIVCKDGIVLGADKRTSAGYMIVNKRQKKIAQITDKIAITHAGLVSDAQLLTRIIRAQVRLDALRKGKDLFVKEVANLLGNLLYNNIRRPSMVPGIVGFLMGGVDSKGYHLFDLGIDGSITKYEDFASTGSGSITAIGVLEALYEPGIAVKEGVELIKKAINAAVQRDMASGDGIDILTITSSGVQPLTEKEVRVSLI